MRFFSLSRSLFLSNKKPETSFFLSLSLSFRSIQLKQKKQKNRRSSGPRTSSTTSWPERRAQRVREKRGSGERARETRAIEEKKTNSFLFFSSSFPKKKKNSKNQKQHLSECCIFHRNRPFGEWSDSDSDCEGCDNNDGEGGDGGAGPSEGAPPPPPPPPP